MLPTLNSYPNSLHQMESAIYLRHCPFPYGSKGFQGATARPSRFHLRFNHATPLCVPQFSTTRHPVTRSVRHVNCMHERFSEPSKNEGSGNKILRGVTGASLVLACVLGLLNFSGKMNPKFITAYASPTHDLNPLESKGRGKAALGSLLEMVNASQNSEETIPTFYENEPSELQINNLKKLAMGLSESGRRDEALKILEKQYNECKKNEWAAEGNVGVALVELLIFQENFAEASERLDEQIANLLTQDGERLPPKQKYCSKLLERYKGPFAQDSFRIAQLILYKAIVHTMLEDKEEGGIWHKAKEAVEWRKAFVKIFKFKGEE